jgi:hypothetical protein
MKPKTTNKTTRLTQPLQYCRTGLVCLLFVAMLVSPTLMGLTHNQPSNAAKKKDANQAEYEIKAAFVYNFMKFIKWPDSKKNTLNGSDKKPKPITIGILGKNPFGKAFDPVLDKKVDNRPIQLVEIESFKIFRRDYQTSAKAIQAYREKYKKTFRTCEIVFISDTEKMYTDELLAILSDQAILTVSDLPEFAQKGGIVGFVIDRKKVRFEINLNSAKREDLQIRSQLLGLAKKVYK